MEDQTTRVDYILSVTSDDIDAALKKLKALEKAKNIDNKNSLIKYREEVIRDKKLRTNQIRRHYTRQDETARNNAITKKYEAITKRKLAGSVINARYNAALNAAKKTEILETDITSKWAYKYDELKQKKELSGRGLDIKEYDTYSKWENEKIKQARLERESVRDSINKNEKAANMRLETARKEQEAILKYRYLNKKEDNKQNLSEKKLKMEEIKQRREAILKNKKLEQAEKRLAINTEKLAMKRQQQERLASKKDRAGRGSRRPFESMMMMLGSFMLMQYAVQMPFLWASSLGDAMANVEMDTRKGHAYRESMIDRGKSVKEFDDAVKRFSELSGEQGYLARVRIANIYGRVEQSGKSVSGFNPEYIANILQGMTAGMGMSDEQADKKLAEILSGKLSKEDRKMFGIRSRTPMQILEEMNSNMMKNPVIASTITSGSATSDMKFIRGAKSELLSRIHDLWGGLFTEITKPMKEFIKTFFGLDNKKVLGEWITTLSTIRDNIEKVFTKQNAQKIAVFINRVVSGISMFLGAVSKFALDHPIISGALGIGALYNKSQTGSIFVPPWLEKIFGNKKEGQKVYVTNMPKDFGKVGDSAGATMGTIIGTKLVSYAPHIASAIAAGIAGYFAGKTLGEHYAKGKTHFEASKIMRQYGVDLEDRQEYFRRIKKGEEIYLPDFMKEHLSKEKYEKFYNEQIKPLEKITLDKLNIPKPSDFALELEDSIKRNNITNNNNNNITNNYGAKLPATADEFLSRVNETKVIINTNNVTIGEKGISTDNIINVGGMMSYGY